jgi:26S proteasome regulatory subunit T2
MCTEAGLIALRERRMRINKEDFEKAKEKVLYLKKGDVPDSLYI